MFHQCAACGSQWFRAVDVYRSSAAARPTIVGSALICLCRTPILLGNFQPAPGARTETLEAGDLLRPWALGNEYDTVAARLQGIEHETGRRIARRSWAKHFRNSPGGRYWSFPRKPLPSKQHKTLTQRDLIFVLQQQEGLLYRQARCVLQAIFGNLKKHLQEHGRAVTKLGVFALVKGPAQQERVRWEKKQILFRHPKKVVFRPSRELREAINPPVAGTKPCQSPTASKNISDNYSACSRCGGTRFLDDKFRQCLNMGSTLNQIDTSAVRVLVCLCGEPVWPEQWRRDISISRASFRQSWEAALDYRHKADPDAILSQYQPSRMRHEQLAELVSRLEHIHHLPRQRPGTPPAELRPAAGSTGASFPVPGVERHSPQCRSGLFVKEKFWQYLKASSPGFHSFDQPGIDPDEAETCLCGCSIRPPRFPEYSPSKQAMASFHQSIAAALGCRPGTILEKLLPQYFATRAQHDSLVARVEQLERVLRIGGDQGNGKPG